MSGDLNGGGREGREGREGRQRRGTRRQWCARACDESAVSSASRGPESTDPRSNIHLRANSKQDRKLLCPSTSHSKMWCPFRDIFPVARRMHLRPRTTQPEATGIISMPTSGNNRTPSILSEDSCNRKAPQCASLY